MWGPATDSFSPIGVFPFTNALGVANTEPEHVRTFVSPDADVQNQPSTSKSASLVPTDADAQNQISTSISACPGSKQKQLKTVKRKVKKDDAGFSRKVKGVRPNSPPSIANISPLDCISLPDIILNIDETERFCDSSSKSEVEVICQVPKVSDSESLQYVPSPTYRLNATSDVTTERLTPSLSPSSSTGSGRCSTPEISNYRVNPLNSARWSDSDSDRCNVFQ